MSAACARSSRPSSVFCPDIQPHKIFSACCKNPQKQPIIYVFGVWRSLVAHLHGVQGVASSNPATPTNKIKGLASQGLGPCSVLGVKTGSAAYNGQGTFRHWCHHAENIFRLSRYCNVRQLLARHWCHQQKTAAGAARCRGWANPSEFRTSSLRGFYGIQRGTVQRCQTVHHATWLEGTPSERM